MKPNKTKKTNYSPAIITGFIACGLLIMGITLWNNARNKTITQVKPATAVKKVVDTKILADGMIRSKNEAILHFQIGGKLVYLPFKEGDRVRQGQTIASLDSYTLQKQLQASLNNYRITRDSFDQLNDNAKDNLLKAQQTVPYDYYSKAGMDLTNKENAYNDVVKRLIDQSQANLDNSVIQVEIANYAMTYSTLSSPIDGIILHQDVTIPNVIVSTQHAFTVIDPKALVMKANISESDIDCIQEGSIATIKLNGSQDQQIEGIITKIYPDKVALPTGESVYQVDIESEQLNQIAKYRQSGTVLIKNKYDRPIVLIPSWLVLSKQYVWTLVNNQPILKKVTIGETVGDNIQITAGLNQNDKVIADPISVISNKYHLL